jgi:hypothetical protein
MRHSRRGALRLFASAAVAGFAPRAALADDAGAECPPDRLERTLADIARARSGLRSLSGPFTQERSIGLLAAKVRSAGVVTLVRPDRLRWELAPPDDVVYWVTPEGLAYRGAGGRGRVPAGSQKLALALVDLRTMLGGDVAALRGRYVIRGTCRGDGTVELRAVPRDAATAPFQELRFRLTADLVAPATATIVEGPRDRTDITFGLLVANGPVPDIAMDPARG